MITEKLCGSWINSLQFLARIFCTIGESIPTHTSFGDKVSRFYLLLWWPWPHFKLCFFGNIRPLQRYKVIFFSGFFCGIHPSITGGHGSAPWKVTISLHWTTWTFLLWLCRPVQEWQSLSQWLHLDVVSAGGACWLFLHLTLSSSNTSCSCSSPLCGLQYSSCL